MGADPFINAATLESLGHGMGIHALMTSRWGWPAAECLHFIGLALLFGAVGFFDLRLLGVMRSIDLRALRRMIPFGVAGFCLSFITGLMFVTTTPDQYLHNPAFIMKMAFMGVAGINMVLFYAIGARTSWLNGTGEDLPLRARVFGAVSLLCWLAVMTCGRVITAFRPPAFYWCPWC